MLAAAPQFKNHQEALFHHITAPRLVFEPIVGENSSSSVRAWAACASARRIPRAPQCAASYGMVSHTLHQISRQPRVIVQQSGTRSTAQGLTVLKIPASARHRHRPDTGTHQRLPRALTTNTRGFRHKLRPMRAHRLRRPTIALGAPPHTQQRIPTLNCEAYRCTTWP
jgi:hypothetical protein